MGERINKNRIDISAVDLEERLLEHKPMEAWLFFRFNSAVTGARWDVCFLMDVGSAFIFGHIVTPKEERPPEREIEKLLKRAYSQFQKWPEIFYCPEEEEAVSLVAAAAASRGIAFVKAPREIFRDLIAPAEEGVKEMFAGRISHEEPEPSLEGFIPDTYDHCFCNSGKKFKFCCRPVFMDITDAMVCAEDGKFQEALACLDRAVEKAGETPELFCRYAIVYGFFDEKNRGPLAELGGLSPKEMARLLYAPVASPESPLVFSRELDEQLIQGSSFYTDALRFLSLFKERQPVKATAAGNLNRKFVSEAFELSGPAEKEKWFKTLCRPVNEYNFMWLNNMRFVFEISKLIGKRKKAFYLTRLGEELLGKPGELFLLLFQTFFYKFNLCYLQFFQEIPRIQDTINFSLFMARNHCKDWTDSELFTGKVLIEGLRIHKEIKFKESSYYDPMEILNSSYKDSFIEPMIDFGLFDTKEIGGNETADEKLFVKSSELLEKFINFKFPANPFQPPLAAGGSA